MGQVVGSLPDSLCPGGRSWYRTRHKPTREVMTRALQIRVLRRLGIAIQTVAIVWIAAQAAPSLASDLETSEILVKLMKAGYLKAE